MEAPDYVLDPDGDVIITLRNFNAPFPILPFDETLSAWENVPQIAVGGQIVETGLPIEAAPPEVVEEVLPINVEEPAPEAVEEVLPIEAEEPAPEAVEEDSGNIWPMEDPFVESPIPSVRLQVSSAHLRLVSSYFKKALDGPFKESHSTTDGLRHIDADDWDTEAFLIVMRIIHGQNRLVSRSLDLEMLAKVAAIVDYYQCHEMLEPFAEIWHLQRKEALIPGTVSRDLILLLFVSWVLRWSEEFKAVTRIAQTQSKGPLSTMGLPIPERIISVIDQQRQETLHNISLVLDDLLDRFRKEPADCSEACSSMQLGALERRLLHQKELQFHASRDKSLIGYSVALAMKAIREIKSPDWYKELKTGYRGQH
ncbi:hypothetical protein F4823DRAFT_614482 [Ustulina deusta]|nr:hypothetical protein F4823DRAFT_614482 [Ustulina deusta]